MSRKRQRGVAVIFAMGVVALAALCASVILVVQGTWARQSELTSAHAQAQFIVQAGADWARALLSDDRLSGMADHAAEPWALRLQPIRLEKGTLSGYIEDQQAAFNLNNLVKNGQTDPVQLAHFQRLLRLLGLPPAIADALVDWIDADGDTRPGSGAEDSYYRALQPPYLAANRPLIDVAELALVRGFDSEVRARLRPFVTALPRFTPVNVNTASPEVIAAVVDGLGLDRARELVSQRQRGYFRNSEDFLRRLPGDATAGSGDIAVGSDYFMVRMNVAIGAAQARGMALLARQGPGWPMTLWMKMQ